MGIEMSDLWV